MKMILVFIFIFTVGVCFNSQDAYAYPNYIRLGYHACMGCHYNPAGGGMLTPYGKGISSTQSFFGSELSDSDEEKLSTQKYFQGIQARLMDYKTETRNRFFPMQADYMGRWEVNPKWKVNFTISVAPKPQDQDPATAPKDYQRTYARFAEVGYSIDKDRTILAGISPLPLGLGLVDHTDYVRSNNRLQITDIPINARFFSNQENYSYNYFAYLPHYLEKPDNSEKGSGGQYWYRINKNMSLGTQALYGATDSIHRTLGGVLFKTGLKDFSYLGEANYTYRKLMIDDTVFGQWTFYNQFSYNPKDWLMLSYVFQGLSKDRDFESSERQHGFLIQAKMWKYFTFLYEARIRNVNHTNELSHVVQGFFQWW